MVGARWSAGVGGAVLCALAVTLVITGSGHDQAHRGLVEALIVGVPMAVGLWATRSPPNVRFGAMLFAAGVIWSLTALAYSSQMLPYSIGRTVAWLIFPVLMYLMLAYPNGRLGGVDRRLYAGLALVVAVLFVGSALFVEAYPDHTPWATCGADCPPNAFLILDAEPAVMAGVVEPLRELLAVLLLVGIAGSMVGRWRTATALQRRLIGPVLATSAVSIGILVAYLAVRRINLDAPEVATLGTLWSLCLPAIAAAFLAGLVWRRVTIGEVLESLSAALSDDVDEGRLRAALAAALRDPTLEVLYPDEVPGRWRDSDGRPASRSAALGRGRAVTPILDDGAPIAALVHDRALSSDEELLDSVAGVVQAALRHSRLTSRLATSLDQLEDSRQRMARSADVERARIERDLHDGAQQRLIALRINLSLAQELLTTDPAAANAALDELGADVDLALEELRSLGQGVYPSLLNDRGPADALRHVLAESPTPGHLRATGLTRHSKEIESAVYFACREAIQNALKHSPAASGVWVTLRQSHVLCFEVRDDGPGFVPPGLNDNGNGGLRNMRDRLETVGGRLTVDSAPGHGTRIRGVVPLP